MKKTKNLLNDNSETLKLKRFFWLRNKKLNSHKICPGLLQKYSLPPPWIKTWRCIPLTQWVIRQSALAQNQDGLLKSSLDLTQLSWSDFGFFRISLWLLAELLRTCRTPPLPTRRATWRATGPKMAEESEDSLNRAEDWKSIKSSEQVRIQNFP